MRSSTFFEKVYAVLEQVPKGKVVTYGQIACAIGHSKASRQVGYALHVNPMPYVIPCHRVVNRFGELSVAFAFGGVEEQARLLREEGVEVSKDYQVNLEKYRYKGNFVFEDEA